MFVSFSESYATLEQKTLREVCCEKCHQEYLYVHNVSVRGTSTQLYGFGADSGHQVAANEAKMMLAYQLEKGADDVPCPRCGWIQDHMHVAARQKKRFDKLLLAGVISLAITFIGFYSHVDRQIPGPVHLEKLFNASVYTDSQSPLELYGWGSAVLLALGFTAWRLILDRRWNPNNYPLEQRLASAAERCIKREDYLELVQRVGEAEAIAILLSRWGGEARLGAMETHSRNDQLPVASESSLSSMTPLVATTPEQLAAEADRLTEMLRERSVARVWRQRPGEIGIEFVDGARVFINWREQGFEFSVTGLDP